MRRLAPALVVVALAVSGSALANHLDPQKKIRPADQARARAMLLKKADPGPGYNAEPSGPESHLSCRALDESDLTVTGEADSPVFTLLLSFVSSASQVYESVADANASWRRSLRAAGTTCLRDEFRREFATQGIELRSFRKISFPVVAQKTAAYRVALQMSSQGTTLALYIDVVALMHSRAQVAIFLGAAESPPPRAQELRLARLVAGRMATAMRGS